MRRDFSGYYRPTESEFAELWKDCLFILDANVLLNLYRYPKEGKNDLVKTLKFIANANRLWIPHQAALEYQENRLRVTAEQVKRFGDVRKLLRKFGEARGTLKGELEKLQLKKRHPLIDPDNFLRNIQREFVEFEATLDQLEEEQPNVSDEDTVRNELDRLLDGKIGAPFSSSELDKIYEEGKTRYEHKCPPGCEDAEKDKDNVRPCYFYKGSTIKRKFGDLILWYQIIDEVKAKEIGHVVFVTDDEKEDWWWIVDSKGKKTIGPRPELVEEIAHKAGVSLFWMYKCDEFLEYAQKYLGVEIAPESIKQARQIAELRRTELEGAVTVSIDAPAEVAAGSDFVARVNISQVTNLNACQFEITYSPAVIQVTDVTSGQMGSTAVPVDTWTFIPFGTPGTIRVLGHIPFNQAVTGSGYLAEIHFRVPTSSGQSGINFTDVVTPQFKNELFDQFGNQITGVTWTGTTVHIA